MKNRNVALFVGTRKGVWIYRSDGGRKKWKVEGPHLLGQVVNFDPAQTLIYGLLNAAVALPLFHILDKLKVTVHA